MTFRLKDLETLTEHEVSEERIHALWRGTQGRVASRRRDPRLAIAIGVMALAGAAAWLLTPSAEQPPTFLALAGGGVPGAVDASGGPVRVPLADGSHILVAPGARWVPTDNRAERFESEIDRGRVTFDVRPGGPRRWVIHAGSTTVEVLGTRFVVERAGARTTVRVSRGRVVVRDPRGPRVSELSQVLLTAGRSVTFDDEHVASEPSPAIAPETPEPVSRASPRRRGSRWQGLAARGDHHEAYRALGSGGVLNAARDADAERLMLLADVARLSGHPADAVAPLERLTREMPEDPRAPIAAVVLGRILMDDLRQPTRARAALQRALVLGVPPPLVPDVERRLAELQRHSTSDER